MDTESGHREWGGIMWNSNLNQSYSLTSEVGDVVISAYLVVRKKEEGKEIVRTSGMI